MFSILRLYKSEKEGGSEPVTLRATIQDNDSGSRNLMIRRKRKRDHHGSTSPYTAYHRGNGCGEHISVAGKCLTESTEAPIMAAQEWVASAWQTENTLHS